MDREDEIIKNLNKLDSRLDSIDKTLVRHDINLQEHMRRTEMAEKRIENVEQELKPVQKHVDGLNGILKFIGVSAVIVGGIASIISVAKTLGLF